MKTFLQNLMRRPAMFNRMLHAVEKPAVASLPLLLLLPEFEVYDMRMRAADGFAKVLFTGTETSCENFLKENPPTSRAIRIRPTGRALKRDPM